MSESLQLVCPHCDTVNRVLPGRLLDGAVCGQCKQALLIDSPLELGARNFDRHIDSSDLPVLVDFWAPWCGPCRTMSPVIGEAAKRLGTQIRVAKVNTEAESEIAARFGIRSIPTLAVFKNGREIRRQAGAVNLSTLMAWLASSLPELDVTTV